MPHAYWSGFLRLSLVSCPIYLSPATSERERVTLHQINPATGNRIKLQPVDAETGEPLERANLIRGYEVEKGQYIELTKDDLETLKIESSRVLELSRFVARDAINPLYLDTPYYVYPENAQASEAYEVIAAAMKKSAHIGIGRIALAQRERPVALQAFDGGLLMSTLHTAEEVRNAEFEAPRRKLDPAMVDLATTIIDRLEGEFEPQSFHDHYQDALRELIAAKQKGQPLRKPRFEEPSNVVDLMAVLKKSLAAAGESANENRTAQRGNSKKARARKADPRQRNLLLPIESEAKPRKRAAEQQPAKPRRKRA